jgi:hypothetical protein
LLWPKCHRSMTKTPREKAECFVALILRLGGQQLADAIGWTSTGGAVCDRFSRPLLAFEAMKLMIVPCAWNEA